MVASRCALEFTHFGKRIDHEATPRGVGHGPTPFSDETGLGPTPRGVAACSIFLAKMVNFSFNW